MSYVRLRGNNDQLNTLDKIRTRNLKTSRWSRASRYHERPSKLFEDGQRETISRCEDTRLVLSGKTFHLWMQALQRLRNAEQGLPAELKVEEWHS
jgi:hypothetical protein